MITSTTGKTAVRLPPHSTATISDERMQAATFEAVVERELEGAAELVHASSVT